MYYFISFLFTFYLIYYVFFYSALFIFTNIINLFFFSYIFYITYASKVRATCIIIPYNDSSKARIWLSWRGRSCLTLARSGMFGLGIAPKEKLSRLFNPVSIQEQDLYLETWLWSPLICTEKSSSGSGYAGLRERIQF